jgi:fructokinase
MSTLLSLGSAVLDRLADDRADGLQYVDMVGGAALNVALTTRRLGIPTVLAAAVADDAAGQTIREFLRSENVALIDAGRGRPTTIAESRRDGPTMQYRFNSSVPSGLLSIDADIMARIRRAPVVVMSALRAGNGTDLSRLASALARAPGICIYDPNPRSRGPEDISAHRHEADVISPLNDIVKLAREDIELLYGEVPEDVTMRLIEQGVRAVVVTDGPRGASLVTEEGVVTFASLIAAEDVVDSLGAGDAALGAIAARLYSDGWPSDQQMWRSVMEFAMEAAAVACKSAGGTASVPRDALVDKDDRDAAAQS